MQTQPNTGLSRLGLGTVQFGLNYGVNNTSGQVPYEAVCRILVRAAEAGINFLDTSRNYGTSETVLGKAVKETGTRFVICTKLDLERGYRDLSDQELTSAVSRSLDLSLEALQLDRLPYYLLHSYDYYTFRDGLIWETAREAQARGLVGELGISIGGGPHEALAALKDVNVRVLQIPCNLFDQRWRRTGFLAEAEERGITLVTRSAYLQGLLPMASEAAARKVPAAGPFKRVLDELAAEWEMGLAELALRYVLDTPEIATTIVGVDTPAQLEENLSLTAGRPLSEGQRAKIELRFAEVPETVVNPSFWTTLFR